MGCSAGGRESGYVVDLVRGNLFGMGVINLLEAGYG